MLIIMNYDDYDYSLSTEFRHIDACMFGDPTPLKVYLRLRTCHAKQIAPIYEAPHQYII